MGVESTAVPTSAVRPRFSRQLLAVLTAVAIAVITAFAAFYASRLDTLQREADAELRTTTRALADELAQWRTERLGDGEVLRRNRLALTQLETDLHQQGTLSNASVRYWLQGYLEAFDYVSLLVLGSDHHPLLVMGRPHILSANSQGLIEQAVSSSYPTLSSIQHDASGQAYLDLIVPLPLDGEHWTVQALVLRVEPQRQLFPMLQRQSGMRETDRSLLLGETSGRYTLLGPDLPGSGAALALDRALLAQAMGQGKVPAGRLLPDSPLAFTAADRVDSAGWIVVRQIERQEMLTGIRSQLLSAGLTALLLLIAAALAIHRIWQKQSMAAIHQLAVEADHRATLEALQKELETAMSIARLGRWERRLDTDELWWSPQTRALIGIPQDEPPSREGFIRRVHPEDRETLRAALVRAYASGEASEFAYRIIRPDGSVAYFHNHVRIEQDPVGGRRAIGTVQDITDQQTIALKLHRQTAYLTAIVNHLPQGISVFDDQLRLQYWNQLFIDILELPPEIVVRNVSFDDLIMVPALRGEYGPGDPAEHVRKRRALAEQFSPHRFERTKPNGRSHLVIGEPLYLDGKVAGFITTYTDITERKRTEEALARNNETLRTIIDNMPSAVSLVDSELQVIACNDQLRRLLAFPDSLFANGLPSLADLIRFNAERGEYGPGDAEEQVATRLARARLGEAHHFERTRPDGTVLEVHGQPVADGGFVTIYTDITDRRRTEARLQLADKVFEHSPEAIVITDGNRRILSVNPAHETISGHAAAHMTGQCFVANEAAPDAEDGEPWTTADTQGFWAGETTGLRADGGSYPRWMTISAVRDGNDNRLTHYIAIFSDITERKRSEEAIQHLAHHDTLTGLDNRFSLGIRLQQAIATTRRQDRRLAVLFLDLDRFKTINDSLGHHVGDALLVEVAKRLRESVRETDVVARLGGDEFVVVLPGLHDENDAAHSAGKILDALSAPYPIGDNTLHTTPSIGISLFPDDGDNTSALMRNADTAMYHAKALGRANFQFYAEELNRAALERIELERKLRKALEQDQFELWYQPQFSAADGALTGVEALIRWRHPVDGLISPARFIPLAEETGLIVELGNWVLHTACQQTRQWREQGLPAIRMSINLSTRQLRSAQLGDKVAAALAASGLPARLLELEITESAVMERPQEAVGVLIGLKTLGVSIAIDDFGTGYSSLSYLKLFPLDHLKIDRSFVSDIEHDPNDAAIVTAAVSLAHNLGLSVIAEGVETAVQLTRLRELGCDEMQGYYFSPPVPAADAAELLRLSARCRAKAGARVECNLG